MTDRAATAGVRDGESTVRFAGLVERGDGRGRVLGFPTANLRQDPTADAAPLSGVYACRARVEGEDAQLTGVANIGVRPTFEAAGGDDRQSIEIHLLDFTDDLYGARMEVVLISRLRDEQRFPGTRELIDQIERDVQRAREILRDRA